MLIPSQSGKSPRLLDRVRAALRVRHYARRTEDAYVDGERIVRLEDSYPEGTADVVVQYLNAHSSKLHPVKVGGV